MNRYVMMKPSTSVTDKNSTDNPRGDNQPWPDPLSIKYSKFFYNVPPTQVTSDDTMITSPFLTTYALYGESTYDDIVFNINNIPHVSLIPYNTTVLYPDKNDIISFVGSIS